MSKNEFLTRRWNNILCATLGIPLFIFIAAVLFTSLFSAFQSFIGIAIAGAAY